MNDKYQCENHTLDVFCMGCGMAMYHRYHLLLEFVKSISNHFSFNETEKDFMMFYTAKEEEAYNILEQIGEI